MHVVYMEGARQYKPLLYSKKCLLFQALDLKKKNLMLNDGEEYVQREIVGEIKEQKNIYLEKEMREVNRKMTHNQR